MVDSNSQELNCLLDLDGVLVDWVKGACQLHNLPFPYDKPENKGNFDIAQTFGMSNEKLFEGMEQNFWASLDPTPECFQILKILEDYFQGSENICLLTSPSRNLFCIPGKLEWIQKHIPAYSRRFIMSPVKKYCARPSNILIDDSDENVRVFKKNHGGSIILPRPWNSLHATCSSKDILEYLAFSLKLGNWK